MPFHRHQYVESALTFLCRKWWITFHVTATPSRLTRAAVERIVGFRDRADLPIESDACSRRATAAAAQTPFAAWVAVPAYIRSVPFAQNDGVRRGPNSTEDRAHSGLFDAFSTELLRKRECDSLSGAGSEHVAGDSRWVRLYREGRGSKWLRAGDIVLLKGEIGCACTASWSLTSRGMSCITRD